MEKSFSFFITPNIKGKQLLRQQTCWRKCGHTDANHSHIFWSCPKIEPFWERVNAVLNEVLGYVIPNKCLGQYLGSITDVALKEDNYLAKVLLTASRKAIKRKWLDVDPPSHSQWLDIVQEIFMMEKMTYSLRLKEGEFNRKWVNRLTVKNG